jgi:hypothetical protein
LVHPLKKVYSYECTCLTKRTKYELYINLPKDGARESLDGTLDKLKDQDPDVAPSIPPSNPDGKCDHK